MASEKQETEKVVEGVEVKPVADPPVEEGKRPRGRPPKDAPKIDPTEPAPRPRKGDAEIKDTRGAIERAVQSLATFARAYQVDHPESDLGWVWKRIREAMPEECGRIGAPIDESAFAPLVRGPVRGVELLGDLPEDEKASAQEINDVAESWARASTHLGLSERVAAVGSAVTKTVGLVGRQLTRTIIAMTSTPPARPEKSTESAAFEEPEKTEEKAGEVKP